MLLSVIIVHYNAHEYLRSCLRSVRRAVTGLAAETIVVDNASDQMAALVGEHPEVTWITNKINAGWGSANNQGAAQSHGQILVFLNPDTELLPDSLRNLHDFFTERKTAKLGPVGGKLLFTNGKTQPSCGPFPCLFGMAWRYFLSPTRRKYYMGLQNREARQVDWVTGAYLAVRRVIFQELAGFDRDFFLYYEDVDFCLRAKQLGYPAYYLPEAAAFHYHPHAVRSRPNPQLKRIIQESRLRYFRKHRLAWESWALDKIQNLAGV